MIAACLPLQRHKSIKGDRGLGWVEGRVDFKAQEKAANKASTRSSMTSTLITTTSSRGPLRNRSTGAGSFRSTRIVFSSPLASPAVGGGGPVCGPALQRVGQPRNAHEQDQQHRRRYRHGLRQPPGRPAPSPRVGKNAFSGAPSGTDPPCVCWSCPKPPDLREDRPGVLVPILPPSLHLGQKCRWGYGRRMEAGVQGGAVDKPWVG